ncbi:MAG TPA: hypothetical protein VFH56_07485 [Acidimicrobiales bacterium]|nr:hypothetical protein [Acidimicrobiales bacterium]
MPATCNHGFAPADCLICRTFGTTTQPATSVEAPAVRQRQREVQPLPTAVPSPPARLDTTKPASPPPSDSPRRHRSLGGSLVLALMALLAVGAAVWILVGVVFTVLHVLELIAVAAGSGWVGYRIGHFRGSRHPHRRG